MLVFLLVMFFFLFVALLLPGPWADLKGQGHRCQRSNLFFFFLLVMFFFCLFPYFSQVLGPILKVKVIEVKGQIFCISAVLGPICMKLGECIQGDP